jgi:ubiquinone/menaquinone biosynthesis C-methylase UbiE
LQVVGCDVKPPDAALDFVAAEVERLPFPDRSFDVVACCHTLEHVTDLGAAWRELQRVARRRVLVVVPRQRYYYYTLDEHLHFFPDAASLERALGLAGAAFTLESIWGDWLLDVALDPTGER